MQVVAKRFMSSVAEMNRISSRGASSTAGGAAVKRPDADPLLMDERAAKAIGATRRHRPGEYMHQKGRVYQAPTPKNHFRLLVPDKVLRKEMRPMWPLAGLVLLAIGLGIMTFYQAHIVHPNVAFRRRRRESLFEIEEPEYVVRLAKKHFESPLRKLSLNSRLAILGHIQQEPPQLGEAKAIVGHSS